MIVFDHLTKKYGQLRAVDDLSFEVQPGRVTGFLGPNGAGKTTTLRVATALIHADGGQVMFDGKTYHSLKKPMHQIGVALEPTIFHPGRTAADHLMMLAPYAGVGRKRVKDVLDFVGLTDVAGKRVGKYSLGMRGRLNLAAALLGDPHTLLLDEPVNGLDPEGIRWIRELLQALARQGRTVLTSSHLLSEVEQTVDEVVIIAHGKLVHQGTLNELESRQTRRATLVEVEDRDSLLRLALSQGWQVRDPENPRSRGVVVEGIDPAYVSRAVYQAGLSVLQLTPVVTSGLEEVFFSLTEGQGSVR
ncbi:MAG: ATP-binding cassette domain-containing protein [Propionibacteriaceae bacterium]|jgi:ABC-2 type transport system ATP-binding protein|nr:ATP-binding cassette domain-containing protein [Propionibacteriaceae bacterium]